MAETKQTQKSEIKEIRGRGRHLRISRKYSVEIGRAIRGMKTEKAMEYLQRVVNLEDYVPVKRFMGNAGHRRGDSWKIGKYPVNAALEFIKIIRNAEENAKYAGFGEDLRISNVCVTRGPTFQPPKHKKRGVMKSSHIQITVKEQ